MSNTQLNVTTQVAPGKAEPTEYDSLDYKIIGGLRLAPAIDAVPGKRSTWVRRWAIPACGALSCLVVCTTFLYTTRVMVAL